MNVSDTIHNRACLLRMLNTVKLKKKPIFYINKSTANYKMFRSTQRQEAEKEILPEIFTM